MNDIPLVRGKLTTLQINLGKLCNQTCVHCHVDAGPHRKLENMDTATAERILYLMHNTPGLQTVDLTGGAPELNPNFRRIVSTARKQGLEVIDRCNLTVLFEPGQEDLIDFLDAQGVRIVASLPCYTSENVEAQRGTGVFAKSIQALKLLGERGYGTRSDRILDLVYNPGGPFLPPAQAGLELDYRARLRADFGIEFTNLFALTNLPVKRFKAFLKRQGMLDEYMKLLVDSFNPKAVQDVMCRSLVSIGWDGRIFDCDFNQMEEIPIAGKVKDIWGIESFDLFSTSGNDGKIPISTREHCFGCTAGQGSSCQGAVAKGEKS
jgi:radical SAM/Cys-rich protein